MKSVFTRKHGQSPASGIFLPDFGLGDAGMVIVTAGPAPQDPAVCHHIRIREGNDSDLRFDFFPAGTPPQMGSTIRIGPDLLDRALRELSPPLCKGSLGPCLALRDRQLGYIWRAIMDEALAGGPGGPRHMARLGQVLAARLALLLPCPAAPSAISNRLSGPVRSRLIAYIDANLDGDLTLATLAAVAGMSSSHLKTLFRASLGEPVHSFVMRRRVERARQLIEEGTLPLVQIALEAGFSHQSHMARWMRRLVGVTPGVLGRGMRRNSSESGTNLSG